AHRPENCKVAAVPTEAAASAAPATQVSSCTATASCGSTATRTPKLLQPLANPDTSAARNAEECQASRTRIGSCSVCSGPGRSRAPLSQIATTSAAMNSATAYTTNGTRSPNSASSPPSTGPSIPPSRNAVAYADVHRPRIEGGPSRTTKDIAETVNIVEPTPPSPRTTRSWT